MNHRPGDPYKDYDQWRSRCGELGYHGPFTISGSSNVQFTAPDGGTEALWNSISFMGYIFSELENV